MHADYSSATESSATLVKRNSSTFQVLASIKMLRDIWNMLQATQFFKYIAISVSVAAISACAFAPGLRVGDLPPSGTRIVAKNGLNLEVQTITASNIPVTFDESSLTDVMPLFDQKNYPIYVLAPGDILGINLWANPEITPPSASLSTTAESSLATGFMIDQAGYVSFPLIGKIKAQGASLESFTSTLKKRLGVYLKQPDAQVRILVYGGHHFNVDGAVKAPGQYAMSNQPTTIYTALTSAGGALENGDVNNILLTRAGNSYHLNLLALQRNNLSPNRLFLKEGDSIHVYTTESRKLYLLGEAGVSNALVIPQQGLSLAGVIGQGQGLNPLSANPTMVYVVRDDAKDNVTSIFHLDLSSIANLALADRFKMQANDIVYVDATGLARWSRVLNLLLPSAQGLSTLGSASYYAKSR
jgi:polysaccharide export outer membrane protein